MNFDGPVRVPEAAGAGTATITLSFDAWKGTAVAPTTHSVPVLPPKPGPKTEPTALNLIASLIHPDRQASIWEVRFSPDGGRLFAAGYPLGIIQIWEVASRKEVRRIDTPHGYRYAVLTLDWKTLYVPVDKRSVKRFEQDGKQLSRIEYAGEIRVWDVASGKEKGPLQPPAGSAPVYAKLAPGGRFLVCVERSSYTFGTPPKDETAVWDLAAAKKWKLCDGFVNPSFSPDGKTVATCIGGPDTKTSEVRLLDLFTGQVRAKVVCPEKDRIFSIGPVSPDGAVVAVLLGGKKGAPLEVWFFDAKTLAARGKLVGKGNPERYGWGWGNGLFTPDGKKFIALGGEGNVLLWDVAGQKVERTLQLGGKPLWGQLAISPGGKTLAVGWAPRADPDLEKAQNPDPQDLPQPRVSLFDLAGNAPPPVLVAPHGFLGGLAFSPDGKLLAFGGAGAVHLFDLKK